MKVAVMTRFLRAWATWAICFLCACSAAVPALPVPQPETLGAGPTVLVIHPGGYQPVDLSREEFKQGMRMLYANGPLPGLPKGGKPRLILASADPVQMARAVGYLDHCQRITGKRFDCWDDLNASGGLDDEGAAFVALHFALGEAVEDAASAVGSMTPTQVRAMMSLMFLGMIVQLLSPEPVTKIIFIVSMTNLIAFAGVDLFNHVVKGFTAMLDELKGAKDFEGVRAAGIRYGQRIGPTVGRIVVMVATYGIAKFAGLFRGSALDLPGGPRAAALAEKQGFRLPQVEAGRSISLAPDGSVVIDLGAAAAMSASTGPLSSSSQAPAHVSETHSLGQRIAGGHAFEKHFEKGEFKDLGIKTREDFARHIDNVVAKATGSNVRSLGRGRTAYWDDATGTVVIHNPKAPDLGTAFRPVAGKRFFTDELK
jgi:hypothetical protein